MASNLQEEIITRMAGDLARSIDSRIMIGMLIDQGWYQFEVNAWKHNSEKNIRMWCNSNCKGSWMQEGNLWVFEEAHDHLLFALRWS